MKITVVGIGYVGLSIAVLLAQHHEVTLIDVLPERVELIKQHKSPLKDNLIEQFLADPQLALDLTATTQPEVAYNSQVDYVVIAVPTNYDSQRNFFDTSIVESVIQLAKQLAPQAVIVIKSTIPIGYTQGVKERLQHQKIIFNPEFLRESQALYDNLYPRRIIVGVDLADPALLAAAQQFARLLQQGAQQTDIPTLLMPTTEAEAVKLFANTYLAMRVAFFNELDCYAELKGLDSQKIIQGVSLDARIGDLYNNPSFGYGGYCLPKDTKQLLAGFTGVPERLISAIVAANQVRKEFIVERVAQRLADLAAGHKAPLTLGVFRLTMKAGSDNFRQSSIHDIIKLIRQRQEIAPLRVIIYEPTLTAQSSFAGNDIVNDLATFKAQSDLIIANRYDQVLDDVRERVYTRDLFHKN